MDIDEILIVDDLDIEILEVKSINDSASISSIRQSNIKTPPSNPVKEHLIKQLNCVQNQIDQAKSNIEVIDNVTKQILANLSKQAAYREQASSESDDEWFSSTGEPVVRKKKKKKNKAHEKQKVIAVKDVWQRVVDDKWVIGVVIESTTTCSLKDPTLYMCPMNRGDKCSGVSSFWTLTGGLWCLIDEIYSDEELVATAVLDLPSFDEDNPCFEAHGTIFCEFDDKRFQTPVPPIKLQASNVVDGSCALDFSKDAKDAKYNVLALKAVSTDRVVLLPMSAESKMGERLMEFLKLYGFEEICKVCIVRDIGSLQYCILEVLPAEDDGNLRILLSARSEAQLSTVIQLMREDFPELLDLEKQQAVDEAAEALREELELYLTCNDVAKLQRARVKTDLLIP